jgi:hypothetical protein
MAVLPEIEIGDRSSESNDSHEQPIFSLTDSLCTSVVDEMSLLQITPLNKHPIGMSNFRGLARKASKLITPKDRWKNAAAKIKLIKDPWDKFEIDKYPVENVVRHRYNPLKKSWKSDDCVVRMESKQFANGAMRSCFRM